MRLSLKRILKESQQEPKDLEEKEFWEDWDSIEHKILILKSDLLEFTKFDDKYGSLRRDTGSWDHGFLDGAKLLEKLKSERKLNDYDNQLEILHQKILAAIKNHQTDLLSKLREERKKITSIRMALNDKIYKERDEIKNTDGILRGRIGDDLYDLDRYPKPSLEIQFNKYLDYVDDYDKIWEYCAIITNAINLMRSLSGREKDFSTLMNQIGRVYEDNW